MSGKRHCNLPKKTPRLALLMQKCAETPNTEFTLRRFLKKLLVTFTKLAMKTIALFLARESFIGEE